MTDIEITFAERDPVGQVEATPLAHLSVEVGHLYMEDFRAGEARVTELFERAAPWVRTAIEVGTREIAPRSARISTCFMIDDYFTTFSSPDEVIPMIRRCAAQAGVPIDYIARESACAHFGGVPLAELVLGLLVTDPPHGTDGSRPIPHESGWLCNGVRSPAAPVTEAMTSRVPWQPPSENGFHRHSVFIDVELWNDVPTRQWSCPYLAAIWQLLRLGVLRNEGRSIVGPTPLTSVFPDEWAQLSPVTQISDAAAPFAAYRTFSVLDSRFVPIEHAVRTIVGQVCVDDAVRHQLLARSTNEGLAIAGDLTARIEYTFTGPAWRGQRS